MFSVAYMHFLIAYHGLFGMVALSKSFELQIRRIPESLRRRLHTLSFNSHSCFLGEGVKWCFSQMGLCLLQSVFHHEKSCDLMLRTKHQMEYKEIKYLFQWDIKCSGVDFKGDGRIYGSQLFQAVDEGVRDNRFKTHQKEDSISVGRHSGV